MTLAIYNALLTLRHKVAGAVFRCLVAPLPFNHAQATRVILDRITQPAHDIADDLKKKENHDQRERLR